MAMESPVLLRYALIKGWTRGNRHGNDDTNKGGSYAHNDKKGAVPYTDGRVYVL